MRRRISARTAGCTMSLSAWVDSSSLNAMAASAARSSDPSAPMMWAPKRSARTSSSGAPGTCSSRTIASASTMTAPRAASRFVTDDLPAPMPPVRTTRITAASLGGGVVVGRLGGGLARTGVAGDRLACADLPALATFGRRAVLAVVLRPGGLALGVGVAGGPVAVLVDLEVLAVLLGQLATLGGLLDRQADPAAGEVEIDDLDPQLLAGRHDLVGRVDVVRRHLRDVHEALDAVADLHERAELDELGDPAVDQLADLVAAGELLPGILLRGLEREADALPAHVHVEDLDVDLVADGDDRAGVVDVLPRQLADVDQPVHAAQVDEGAEADDRRHGAVTHLADLEVGEELVARLLLGLLQVGPAAQHDVVAVL